MSERFERDDDETRPWEADADAWRGGTDAAGRHAEPWPQLAAGPAYWMWLALFEEEHGIDG